MVVRGTPAFVNSLIQVLENISSKAKPFDKERVAGASELMYYKKAKHEQYNKPNY